MVPTSRVYGRDDCCAKVLAEVRRLDACCVKTSQRGRFGRTYPSICFRFAPSVDEVDQCHRNVGARRCVCDPPYWSPCPFSGDEMRAPGGCGVRRAPGADVPAGTFLTDRQVGMPRVAPHRPRRLAIRHSSTKLSTLLVGLRVTGRPSPASRAPSSSRGRRLSRFRPPTEQTSVGRLGLHLLAP